MSNKKGLILGFMAGGLSMALPFYAYYQRLKFENAYNSALVRFADVDKDGIISQQEENDFRSNLIKRKNAVWVNQESFPRSADGGVVSFKTLTEWINRYSRSQEIK